MVKALTKQKLILLASSVTVLPLLIAVFKTTTFLFNTKWGYLTGFIVYWIYCITISFILIKQNKQKLNKIFQIRLKSRYSPLIILFSFLPVFGVFFIQFLPNIDLLTKGLVILILTSAIFNGLIEELYWRGLYLLEFKHNIWIGVWFSTFFFGTWHIALYTIRDIDYGGFAPLVFGSVFMGILWSFCARRLNSIAFPVVAHIFVNIFAFTGLYVTNGF